MAISHGAHYRGGGAVGRGSGEGQWGGAVGRDSGEGQGGGAVGRRRSSHSSHMSIL